jgi:hypothetical protein
MLALRIGRVYFGHTDKDLALIHALDHTTKPLLYRVCLRGDLSGLGPKLVLFRLLLYCGANICWPEGYTTNVPLSRLPATAQSASRALCIAPED